MGSVYSKLYWGTLYLVKLETPVLLAVVNEAMELVPVLGEVNAHRLWCVCVCVFEREREREREGEREGGREGGKFYNKRLLISWYFIQQIHLFSFLQLNHIVCKVGGGSGSNHHPHTAVSSRRGSHH